MKHILGVYGRTISNLTTKQEEYEITLEVSDEIIDWLEMHDKEIDALGNTIYICNKIKYIYLGPAIEVSDKPKTQC